MKIIVLLILIFLYSCTDGSSGNSNEASNPKFDVVDHVEIYLQYDTINSGETQNLKIDLDKDYYSLFPESPTLIRENQEFALNCPENCKLTYQTTYGLAEENEKLTHKIQEQFRFKTGENKDTILTFSGSYVITNLASTKRSEGAFLNGKKEGIWKFWYDNERKHIKEVSTWKNGAREGSTKTFSEGEKLKSFINYRSGLPDGMSYQYSESGQIVDSTFYKNGKIVEHTANIP